MGKQSQKKKKNLPAIIENQWAQKCPRYICIQSNDNIYGFGAVKPARMFSASHPEGIAARNVRAIVSCDSLAFLASTRIPTNAYIYTYTPVSGVYDVYKEIYACESLYTKFYIYTEPPYHLYVNIWVNTRTHEVRNVRTDFVLDGGYRRLSKLVHRARNRYTLHSCTPKRRQDSVSHQVSIIDSATQHTCT